jgi:pentapeptide MXKDX repeat protein
MKKTLFSAVLATAIATGFAMAPAFADDMKKTDTMSKDSMKKDDGMSKSTDSMKKDDGMAKTDMSKDTMKK